MGKMRLRAETADYSFDNFVIRWQNDKGPLLCVFLPTLLTVKEKGNDSEKNNN